MGRRRSSDEMTPEQKELFHRNFRYMWDKLGTSYYYIVGTQASGYTDERRNGINDDLGLLPSYSVCAACYSGNEGYWPSKDVVRRIVAFYNQWIKPEITPADFGAANDQRYRPGSVYDPRFFGVYRGYYYSQVSEKIAGAYLIIFENRSQITRRMKAALITNFYSDEAMENRLLYKEVLSKECPSYSGFRSYRDSLSADARQQEYYEGDVEMSNDVMMISFSKAEQDFGRIAMMVNTDAFPYTERYLRPNKGGLAFVLSTEGAGTFPSFFTFGYARAGDYELSMLDPALAKILDIPKKPYLLRLRPQDDKKWIQFIAKHKAA